MRKLATAGAVLGLFSVALASPPARAEWPAWFRTWTVDKLASTPPARVHVEGGVLWLCYWNTPPGADTTEWAGVKAMMVPPRVLAWQPADDAQCDPETNSCHAAP